MSMKSEKFNLCGGGELLLSDSCFGVRLYKIRICSIGRPL